MSEAKAEWGRGQRCLRHSLADGVGNNLDYAFGVSQHFFIPEPQHLELLAAEPSGAAHIVCMLSGLCMLAAIHFDNKARREADKVREIRA